jgi:hypothetical protein
MADGILDDYENADNGLVPTQAAPPYAPPGRGGFADRMTNPLVLFGLGLASGKTPQEGFAGGMKGLLAGNQLSSQREGQAAAYQAAIKAGISPQQAMAYESASCTYAGSATARTTEAQ